MQRDKGAQLGGGVFGNGAAQLLELAAAQGSTIEIETDGADEAQAMAELTALVADFFGEGE